MRTKKAMTNILEDVLNGSSSDFSMHAADSLVRESPEYLDADLMIGNNIRRLRALKRTRMILFEE
jgi:hypothetical protein